MSKVPFTEEQIQMLRNNPYTYKVTPNTLSFTKRFKEQFYQEYLDGAIPRQILEKYGYPAIILGKQRILGIAHCIKKEYQEKGSFDEGYTSRNPSGSAGAKSPEENIKQLQHEVDYLKQEVEFLKKISSIRNIRK